METYNIAVVKPNDFNRQNFDLGVTHSQILDKISPFIEFVQVNLETMMETIVNVIGLTKETIGATNIFYQTKDSIYQMCHLNMQDNGNKEDSREINGICSSLNMENLEIRGSVVLIRCNIEENHLCSSSSIDINTITDIVFSKIVHKGVRIDPDGTVSEFTFLKDPMDGLSQEEIENYQWMELPLFKLNLIVFIQVEPVIDQVNKKMTQLVGNSLIHGSSLLVLKSVENEFLDMDVPLLNQLLTATMGKNSKRTLSEEELKDGEKINELPMVVNGFRILDKRVLEYKNKCEGCGVDMEDHAYNRCTGCYRVCYHSKDCQKGDWHHHKNDCLFGQQPLNRKITKKKVA